MRAPTRRTFLALGAFAGLALPVGCTGGSDRPPAPQQQQDPDAVLRLRQLAATDALLADYDAAAAASPADAARLGDLREDVLQHRTALARSLPADSPSPSPSASASATAPARGVAELAAAERRTAGLRLADLAAASPELARTLAAVAASGAAHAAALGDTGGFDPAAPPPAPSGSASAAPSAAPSGSAAPAGADTGALQAALAAEHAAVYGYGVVGAFLPVGPQREDGRAAYAAHQARRDAWQRLLAGRGASPAAAAAGYRLPFPVKDAAAATQLAAHLEIQLTAAYADLAATAAFRAEGAAALRECALRAVHWGADLPALPGIMETAEPTGPATP
ncbi:DUF4439 domain-containing protein [Kitasatospora sp. NPDC088134]|uniref:DUF4439 domain-containing protein n=1 Tax=Kitasatospora sp. NPDC088134 TaxID=3364071 RepID=UPI00380F28D6